MREQELKNILNLQNIDIIFFTETDTKSLFNDEDYTYVYGHPYILKSP